ncbi:MAG: M15 family metallopeptidase [Sarcina sp.]
MNLENNKKIIIGIVFSIGFLIISLIVMMNFGGDKAMVNNKDNSANILKNEIESNLDEEVVDVFSIVKNNVNDLVILCNKDIMLGETYIPTDLVIPKVPLTHDKKAQQSQLRKPAAEALERMLGDAKKVAGLEEMYLVSGYRSYDYQYNIFHTSMKNRGKEHTEKYMAKPGHSEHQTGLTADISTRGMGFDLTESFENTKEGQWLANNAHKYGYILRYPKDRIETTGYAYEPWHFRYVGTEISTYMFENKLVLEDLYDSLNDELNSVG